MTLGDDSRGKAECMNGDAHVRHRSSNGNVGQFNDTFHNNNNTTLAAIRYEHGGGDRNEKQLIGINGYWYDISSFIPHHPGGAVIEQFVGKDATCVFHSMHDKDVLKYRKPVGTYQIDTKDPAAEKFGELHKFFINNGFFQTSFRWYAMKFAVAAILLGTCFLLVIGCEKWYFHYLGAVILAAFWQQCGFFMHDFMHNQGFHDRTKDQWLGTFFGTTCVGICGSWWRDEHFIHHALTNTVDYTQNFFDPQMREPVWAQNSKLFPFYNNIFHLLAIKFQHITFIPICVGVGRIGIVLDSFKQEKRVHEWIAFGLHWSYIVFLLSFLPTWRQVIIFYVIASLCEGILHIQLLISHYAKPFFLQEDICTSKNWYRMQIECNINIKTPIWLDWFHGGLNYHIEHHLYPTMPRHKYREASKHIKNICDELGIEYDECGWFEAVSRTLQCLKSMSKHFKLDPR